MLFLGVLVAQLDFSINRFNLLPDVVGYGLIWLSLTRLQRYHPLLGSCIPLSLALGAVSLHEFVPLGWLGRPLGLVQTLGFAVLVWWICGAVQSLAEVQQLGQLAALADRARWAQAVAAVLSVLSRVTFLMAIPAFVVWLIALVLVSATIFRASKVLSPQAW